jgi:L-fucose isomerase-like protein
MEIPNQPGTMVRPRVGVVVTSWPHESGAEYSRALPELFPKTAPLEKVELVVSPTLLESERDVPIIAEYLASKQIEVLLLIPGNFTLDHIMPIMAQAVGLPTILWGMTTQEAWGAFVGLQQTFFPFKELGINYRVVIGGLGDERAWGKIVPYARAAAMVKRLKGLRVGLMGWRAQGMSDVVFDELALRETFGVQVVNVGLTRYERTVNAVPAPDVESAWRQMESRFDTSIISPEAVRYGVQSYLAMQKIAVDEDLKAVTVECFHDHLGGPCLGCSLFNDQGIAASCESDVPGAIIMAAGQILTGKPTFHADVLKADLVANSAIWHHCGNMPTTLASNSGRLQLRPIPEHIGPGAFGPNIQATMRPGPVTAINLCGRRGTMRVAALQGEAVHYDLEFPGSVAKVIYPFDLAQALEALGEAGYGHHFALAQGHVGCEVGEWCKLLGIEYLSI